MIVVLDTNVVSAMMRAEPDEKLVAWLDAHSKTSLWTTAVSVYEVRWGLLAMASGARRSALAEAFEGLLHEDFEDRVLPLDRAAAERAAALHAERRARGKIVDVKDTLIAGIVLDRAGVFATRNVRHFADLGVRVVDPWDDMPDTRRSA